MSGIQPRSTPTRAVKYPYNEKNYQGLWVAGGCAFLICGAFLCACGGKSVGPEGSLGRALLSASGGPL